MVGQFQQYPHYLYKEISKAPETDENGDRIPGASEWVYVGRCREETNGKGETISTADRKEYRFSSLVQLPVGTPRIPEGTGVLVSEVELDQEELEDIPVLIADGTARITGCCSKFDPGRLHCRLWI